MATIKIEFSTDNSAFGEVDSPEYNAEVCYVLSKVTSKLTNGNANGSILDTHGNRIGSFEITE
jgi:hypothetical protein